MKAIAACLLIVAAGQGKVLYRSPDSSLVVSNFTSNGGVFLEDGNIGFDAVGTPLKIESLDRGFTISAAHIKGVLVPQREPTTKASYIKEMTGEGGMIAHFDSQVAHDYQVSRAIQDGGLVPAAMLGHDTADIRSERFTFAGDPVQGTLTLPGKFTFITTGLKNDTLPDGTSVTKVSRQSSTMTGTSGLVTLWLGAGIDRRVKTATVEGPITFVLDQVETDAKSITPVITNLKGWADRAEIDMEKGQTITLLGNVKLQGERGLYLGTSEGDKAVITLDKELKPSSIRITGEPTKSTLREKKGGGGSK
ncbi:MAG: hypothetical protein H7Y17_17105 [Chlorobia bacterium]|nr:hypothetical protein [Fimbriimonadaceae bacterium]